jgi:hypothetical protein
LRHRKRDCLHFGHRVQFLLLQREEDIKNSPGLGYVLGDEASGAYLGKKVIQYYLYNTFDEDLVPGLMQNL